MPNTAEAKTDKVLADALEALMGAIWRDGGVEAVRPVNGDLERSLERRHEQGQRQQVTTARNAMEHKLPMPQYRMVERSGPDHAPQFIISVSFDGRSTEAAGTSKRQAEQEAAS